MEKIYRESIMCVIKSVISYNCLKNNILCKQKPKFTANVAFQDTSHKKAIQQTLTHD